MKNLQKEKKSLLVIFLVGLTGVVLLLKVLGAAYLGTATIKDILIFIIGIVLFVCSVIHLVEIALE